MNKILITSLIAMSFVLVGCGQTIAPDTTSTNVAPEKTLDVQVPTVTPVETPDTTTYKKITVDNSWYKITLSVPETWTLDEQTSTLKKGDEKIIFDPDYSPGQGPDANIQRSTIETDGGETLSVTTITYKEDPSQGILVHLKDKTVQSPPFYFSFFTPQTTIDPEFYSIIKTITWIAVPGK